MTGHYPYHKGLAKSITANCHPFGVPLNQTTIPKVLKMGGCATHCVAWKIASWHS